METKVRWAPDAPNGEYERFAEGKWVPVSRNEIRKLLTNGATIHYNPA